MRGSDKAICGKDSLSSFHNATTLGRVLLDTERGQSLPRATLGSSYRRAGSPCPSIMGLLDFPILVSNDCLAYYLATA